MSTSAQAEPAAASAALDYVIEKVYYKDQVPELRAALLAAQVEMTKQKKFPVILIVAGVDGSGKGELVQLFNKWMDPRHIETHAIGDPDDQERERPPMWRFWNNLPPKGKLGVFFGSWYSGPIYERAYMQIGKSRFERSLDQIVRFERMLADEGALIIKLWLRLSKRQQKKRFDALTKKPDTAWRVTDSDWRNHERYASFERTGHAVIARTSSATAPWVVIEAKDTRYRNLTACQVVLRALRNRLDQPAPSEPAPKQDDAPPPILESVDRRLLLRKLDLTKALPDEDYERELVARQAELNELSRALRTAGRSLALVFEGNDAAGKGGAIRRVTNALDARHFRIIPTAAPTEDELAQPYLWRFWRHIPGLGTITMFDRSWYGRLLVERVEGLCSEADWMRAYNEINDFEDELTQHRVVLIKFWLSINKGEQLARFKDRQEKTFKQFKITEQDWRTRDKWNEYEQAVCDMVERTSTPDAPWVLVEANDKNYARIKILKTIIKRLKAEI